MSASSYLHLLDTIARLNGALHSTCSAIQHPEHQHQYHDSAMSEILLFNKNFPFWLSKANGKVEFKILAGDVPIICNRLVVTVNVHSDSVLPYTFAREAHLGAPLQLRQFRSLLSPINKHTPWMEAKQTRKWIQKWSLIIHVLAFPYSNLSTTFTVQWTDSLACRTFTFWTLQSRQQSSRLSPSSTSRVVPSTHPLPLQDGMILPA